MVTQLKQALQRKLWQWFFSVDAAGRKVYSPFCSLCTTYHGCSHGLTEQKVFASGRWQLMCPTCSSIQEELWRQAWRDNAVPR